MSKIYNKLQTKKSRRDNTLLTVDVNLRTEKVPPPLTSPEGTTLWKLKMSKLKIIREIKMDKFYRRMRLLSGAEAYHRRLLSRSVYPNHDTSTALSTGFDKINKILKINHLYNPENLNKIKVQTNNYKQLIKHQTL